MKFPITFRALMPWSEAFALSPAEGPVRDRETLHTILVDESELPLLGLVLTPKGIIELTGSMAGQPVFDVHKWQSLGTVPCGELTRHASPGGVMIAAYMEIGRLNALKSDFVRNAAFDIQRMAKIDRPMRVNFGMPEGLGA